MKETDEKIIAEVLVVVAPEVAEVDFERFVYAWDIDGDTDNMNVEDKESFLQQKSRIVRAIRKGRASIDVAGDVHFHPQFSKVTEEIIFKVPLGASYLSMDSYKDRQNMHKMYSYMASMTKKNSKTFSNMDARDTKFCMGVAVLFLAS